MCFQSSTDGSLAWGHFQDAVDIIDEVCIDKSCPSVSIQVSLPEIRQEMMSQHGCHTPLLPLGKKMSGFLELSAPDPLQLTIDLEPSNRRTSWDQTNFFFFFFVDAKTSFLQDPSIGLASSDVPIAKET